MSSNFQELYEQFNLMYDKIFPRIKKIVKDVRDAEEIMQDTGMKIFQNQSNLKVETLDRWISTVARNLALNKQKAQKELPIFVPFVPLVVAPFYFAPRPRSTTGTVFSKIFKSKSKDQLSM